PKPGGAAVMEVEAGRGRGAVARVGAGPEDIVLVMLKIGRLGIVGDVGRPGDGLEREAGESEEAKAETSNDRHCRPRRAHGVGRNTQMAGGSPGLARTPT